MKRIKDNITPKDFRFLMNFLQSDEGIRQKRKNRLQKIFTLLYSSGIRLNEVQSVTKENINELLSEGRTKIPSPKQKKEKFIYVSSEGKKLIQKYFNPEKGYTLLSERNNKFHSISLINDVNSYLKKVFPNKNITSHSFRQTLISDLMAKSVNPKVVQELVSHKNVQTTLGYYKPSKNDLFNALEVR